jgi:multiple antibiotic resistance protein
MIFALLFLMLGPIKLLGPFAAATKNCDRVFRFRLATRAFLFSIAAVTIAAGFGARILDNFAIPLQVLQIAAGLILFLVFVIKRNRSSCVFRSTPMSGNTEHFSPLHAKSAITPRSRLQARQSSAKHRR